MAKPYNGHKNWNHWNVSLWINNDEGLYQLARDAVRRHRTKDAAARHLLDDLTELGATKTPDGAPYTVTTLRAAISEL
jgi:hypothetical protein